MLAVVGLIFTEGHAATEGPQLIRDDLCAEAVRLAGLLHRLLPDEAEVLGLYAVLLITGARRDARVDDDDLVLLADQDRDRWHWPDIGRGLQLATDAVRRGGADPGPWTVQAAIAASHVQPAPDRSAIAALYDRLATLTPSPAVLVNRAAAVAQARGPEAGLAALGTLGDYRALVLRAELYAQLSEAATQRGETGTQRGETETQRGETETQRGEAGTPRGEAGTPRGEIETPRGETETRTEAAARLDDARKAMSAAVAAARNDVERRHLTARLAQWSTRPPSGRFQAGDARPPSGTF